MKKKGSPALFSVLRFFALLLMAFILIFSCTRQDNERNSAMENTVRETVLVISNAPGTSPPVITTTPVLSIPEPQFEMQPEPQTLPENGLVLNPIAVDPGDILSWPLSSWRDRRYEVFSWDNFPEILIFDTVDYAVQDLLFKRLAFFVEKEGFIGYMAHNEEIAHLHGWNAHNYRAEDLAVFFQTARENNFPLNAEEWELEYMLLTSGIIRWNYNGEIIPGRGAVLSISRESNTSLRSRFLAHEAFHGLYFIDEDFRFFSRMRWEAFPSFARDFILAYFMLQAYDLENEYLVINEFMAHILQFSVANASWYFGEHLPNILLNNSSAFRSFLPEREERTNEGRRYYPDLAQVFTGEAETFSSYVNQRWGLAAGRVWN